MSVRDTQDFAETDYTQYTNCCWIIRLLDYWIIAWTKDICKWQLQIRRKLRNCLELAEAKVSLFGGVGSLSGLRKHDHCSYSNRKKGLFFRQLRRYCSIINIYKICTNNLSNSREFKGNQQCISWKDSKTHTRPIRHQLRRVPLESNYFLNLQNFSTKMQSLISLICLLIVNRC